MLANKVVVYVFENKRTNSNQRCYCGDDDLPLVLLLSDVALNLLHSYRSFFKIAILLLNQKNSRAAFEINQ